MAIMGICKFVVNDDDDNESYFCGVFCCYC